MGRGAEGVAFAVARQESGGSVECVWGISLATTRLVVLRAYSRVPCLEPSSRLEARRGTERERERESECVSE